MRSHLPSQRAFTLTELLLALLIGATLVGLGLLGFRKLNDRQQLEAMRSEFFLQAKELKNSIRADIEVAVLNNGYTAAINTLETENPSQEKFFGLGTSYYDSSSKAFTLQVFKPFNQFFSTPMSITNSTAATLIGFNSLPPKIQEYWQEAIAGSSHFLISNDRRSFIFPKAKIPTGTGGSQTTSYSQGVIAPAEPVKFGNPLVQADYQNSTNIIRTVERVLWKFEDNKLKRVGHQGNEIAHETIRADRVRSFRVGYTFRKVDENDQAIIPALPTGTLSASNLPNTLKKAWDSVPECATPNNPIESTGKIKSECVKPQNINDVYVQLSLETDLPSHLWNEELSGYTDTYDDMQITFNREGANESNKKVLATIDFEVRPRSYSNTVGRDLASGESVACDVSNSANHCQPECAHVFNDPSRSSPRWVGYGRYVGYPDSQGGASSYCKCWTNKDHWNKPNRRDVFVNHYWRITGQWGGPSDTSVNNRQIEACALEYGCAGSDWYSNFITDLHPGYRLACQCLRGAEGSDNYFVTRGAADKPQFAGPQAPETGGLRLKTENLNWGNSELKSIKDDGALSKNIRCTTYQGCWNAMTDYFTKVGQSGSLPEGNNETNPFTDRCSCLDKDIPYACDTKAIADGTPAGPDCVSSTWEGINIWHLDFNKLCNQAFRNGTSSTMACRNTWSNLDALSALQNSPETMAPFNIPVRNFFLNFNPATNQYDLPLNTFNRDLSKGVYHTSGMIGFATFESRLGINSSLASVCECLENQVTGQFVGDNWQGAPAPQLWTYPSSPYTLDFRQSNQAPPGYTPSYSTDGSNVDRSLTAPPVTVTKLFQQQHLSFVGTCQLLPIPGHSQPEQVCNIGGQQVVCLSLAPSQDPTAPQLCYPWSFPSYPFSGINSVGLGESISCGQRLCEMGFGGSHCCTASNPDGLNLISPGLEAWVGYCREGCRSGLGPHVNRVDLVRNHITPGSDLVIGCGGSTPGSSQAQGAF